MKSRSPLIISLGVNIGLVGFIFYLIQHWPLSPDPVLTGSAVEEQPADQPANLSRSGTRPQIPPSQDGQGARFSWRTLESTDYPTYMANLRAVGCPEQTVRDIILADLTKSYAQRRAQLRAASTQPYRYWATRDQTELPAAQAQALEEQERALEAERRAVIQNLLGVDADAAQAGYFPEQDEVQQKLAFLDTAKREQVRSILDRFAGLEKRIEQVGDGNPQADSRVVYQQYKQRREELRQVLTPEEFEQYDMNFSWTGKNVREALMGFNPTEEEFRAIFKSWRAHDDYLANLYANDEQGQQKDPGNEHVKAAIKAALGEERYQEYQNAWWNRDYHQLARIARDQGLPSDTPARVYQIKQMIESVRAEAQANSHLSDAQRWSSRQELRTQAEQMLLQTLGQSGFQAYQEKGAGWLKKYNR